MKVPVLIQMLSGDMLIKLSEMNSEIADLLLTNYGTFVPTYFHSRERKFHRWNFRSLELSFLGTFAPQQ